MSRYKCSLLVVDDEPSILDTLKIFLSPEFDVLTADCADAAQKHFANREIDLILTDQKMPRVSGVQLLEWVKEHSPKTIRLMMTGFAELEETINRVPCDLVLVATPIDLARLITLNKPSLRVTYEVEDLTHPGLAEILVRFTRERTGVGV